jgi:drug/metabolite transporter (DMT)-like permease
MTVIIGDSVLLGVGLAVLATLAVSLTSLSVRVGTEEGGTLDALLVVLGTNALVFVPTALFLYYPSYQLTPVSVGAFFGAGVVATLLGRTLSFVSFRRIGASRTEPIRSAHPLSATVVAVLVLSETVSAMRLVGIGLIVAGVAYISWESNRSDADSPIDGSSLQLLIPMGAAFFYGLEPTLAKVGLEEGTPALVGLSIKTVSALVLLSLFLGYRRSLPRRRSVGRLLKPWFLVAGLLNTVFMGLYYVALQIAPVTLVIPIIATSPLVVVVLSRLYLPDLERVSIRLVAGAVVVVVGAVAVTLSG